MTTYSIDDAHGILISDVRRIVGRRTRITRDDMAAILASVPNLPDVSTITGRDEHGTLVVGDEWVEPVREIQPDVPPSMRTIDRAATDQREREATARAWARACTRITCVSIIEHDGQVVEVRHDEPGSMHPLQYAEVLFAPAALGGYDYDQIGQLRRYADRVLVVDE
ncbi:hypothetical protein BH23ACI1_BH23ACI1_33350 [soil metagenome]|nr:hypothetical protein [Acidobacteriota bacterium]